MSKKTMRPLCVDLDGTLILGDATYETMILYLKQNPLHLFLLLWWLITKGKSYCKEQTINKLILNDFTIPINPSVYSFCEEEFKKHHRDIYIVSGTHERIVSHLSYSWPFVKGIWGSNKEINLISHKKAQFLSEQFGERGFDYIGNSRQDIAVWKHCHDALAVGTWDLPNKTHSFEDYPHRWTALFQSLRLSHWVKNLLLLFPLFLLRPTIDLPLLLKIFLALLSFSFLSTGSYLLNDLFDLQSDRKHFKKKNRPLAQGQWPMTMAIKASLFFGVTGMVISYLLSPAFSFLLLIYFFLNQFYTYAGKHIPVCDVFCTTSFYMLRLFAGAALFQVTIPTSFSLFFFFFFMMIGHLKLYLEMREMVFRYGRHQLEERHYEAHDLSYLFHFGPMSGFLSLVFYTGAHWPSQALLLPIAILSLWISSVWFYAHKGQLKTKLQWYLTGVLTILLGIIEYIM